MGQIHPWTDTLIIQTETYHVMLYYVLFLADSFEEIEAMFECTGFIRHTKVLYIMYKLYS